MNYFHLIQISILAILFGCNPNQSELSIQTAGIFKPFNAKLENQEYDNQKLDLGEHVTTNGPKTITLELANNSDFPYTELSLIFNAEENDQNSVTTFKAGESGGNDFPGLGGTCKTTIQPRTTCKIILSFAPRENRQYNEIINLQFKNLVDRESHTITYTILAGTPPQLSLIDDKTQYTFGQLVGSAKTPVIEREEIQTFTEIIKVKNTGGLSAKNVTVMVSEDCISSLTGLCPTGMNNAYSMTTTCKDRIKPNEVCEAVVTFRAKNQNPLIGPVPADIIEIDYKGNLNFSYKKSATDDDYLNLNTYFRTVSTNIKAKFKSSAQTITFSDKLTAGKRDLRTYRLSNNGFREGEIRALVFRNAGNNFLVSCKDRNNIDILTCYKQDLSLSTLSYFPFYVKDRNRCLRETDSSSPKFINVEEGCVFDIVFQPSTTFTTDKLSDFLNLKMNLLYDDKLKGLTNVIEEQYATLNAQSISPARLEVASIVYDSQIFPVTSGSISTTDFGRLAMQSLQFYKRKSLIITFKNNGSSKALGIQFKDGKNNIIPIGGTTINLGLYPPQYYASVIGSETNCTVVPAGENCTLSMNFAPISLGNSTKETDNMFDGIDAGSKRFKDFIISYDNGSTYTDTNFTDTPDAPKKSTTARIFATLVRKGKLQPLTDDSRNLSSINAGVNVIGDKYLVKLVLQNIGAGEIPYIRFMNPPSPNFNRPSPRAFDYDFKVINSTPTDIANYNVTKDCKTVLDIDENYTVPLSATPGSRIGNFSALYENESCLLTFEAQRNNRFYRSDSYGCSDSQGSDFTDALRYFSQEALANNPSSLWEPCRSPNNLNMTGLQFDFYDGDNLNPSPGVDATYGARATLSPLYNLNILQSWQAKLMIYNPTPYIGATFYRQGYTMPMLNPGISSQTARNITAQWFWGPDQNYTRSLANPAINGSLFQGDKSRSFVPLMSSWADRTNYDYVYFIGNFPQNSGSMVIPISLKNHGGANAKIIQFTSTGLLGSLTPKTSPTIGSLIGANAIMSSITYDLLTSTPGEQKAEFNLVYETGEHFDPLNFNGSQTPTNANSSQKTRRIKVLILANVITNNTYPRISISTQDYSVSENIGSPPTVSLNGPVLPQTLSWNITPVTSTIVFDSIKYPNTATTSDIYAQKRVTITNNSGFTISNMAIIFRDTVGSNFPKTLPSSFTTVSNTCGASLGNGLSCNIILRYLPRSSDLNQTFVMSVLHQIGTGTFAVQNLGISLSPRSAGTVIANGRSATSINYKVTSNSPNITRTSYPLVMGTQQLDVIPKVTKFDQTGNGNFRKIAMININSTKTSFLLAYHLYLTNNNLRGYSSGNKPDSSVVPDLTEYRTVDGLQYAIIHKLKYANNSDRIIVEASKGCLFGDDENNVALAHNEKGFNNATSAANPCLLIFTHNANFEYLTKNILANNGDDMRENATELWYYSYSRSTTASIWLHATGTFNPDTSNMIGSYTNVTAFDTPSINFNIPRLTETTPTVGTITGLRIIMGTSAGVLNSPYDKSLTNYIDIPYSSGTTYSDLLTFTSGLIPSEYRYFRVLAIREHPLNNSGSKFLNLSSTKYLSLVVNPASILKVLVPPANHHYFHAQKILVMKDLFDGVTYNDFTTTKSKCSNAPSLVVKDPSTFTYKYRLITRFAWNLIKNEPQSTSYLNSDRIAHWIDDPLVDIDQVASTDPSFTPNTSSQVLENSKIFYLRNSSNPSALVNQAVGGVSGANFSYWDSYVDGGTGYASARCMVVLP